MLYPYGVISSTWILPHLTLFVISPCPAFFWRLMNTRSFLSVRFHSNRLPSLNGVLFIGLDHMDRVRWKLPGRHKCNLFQRKLANYNTFILLEGLTKSTNNLTQDSLCRCRDLKQRRPDYGSEYFLLLLYYCYYSVAFLFPRRNSNVWEWQ
jgi:hypothetical protein